MIRILLVLIALISAGCATTGGAGEESEPTLIEATPDAPAEVVAVAAEDPKQQEESKQQEGEVPLAVAETEQPDAGMAEVVVQGHIRTRHEAIHDLVTEAQTLLR